MALIQIPLVGPQYTDETRTVAVEETVNFYVERVETAGGRESFVLKTRPGLTSLITTLPGFVRGMREMGGVLYVVAGNSLLSVTSGGVATTLGTVLGSARCVLTDNFIPDTRRQLVIMTGERGYVYDTVTGFVEITDTDFTDVAVPVAAAFLSGYITVPTEDGFIWSAVTDATSWAALDFKTAESAPDRVVTLLSAYGDLWLFGGRTTEIFRVTDAEDVFQRIQTIEYGCGSPYACCVADNRVWWLDQYGRIWAASGFQPQRVSTHPVEQYLQGVDFSAAWFFTYVDRGHEFVGFTIPSGQTWLYDISVGIWTRYESFDDTRWQVNAHAFCYGENLFGDYSATTVWTLDKATVLDGTQTISRRRRLGYLHEDGNPIHVSELYLTANTGLALVTGTTPQTAPVVEMRYSDDGGNNFTDWKARSAGLVGQYAKKIDWHRLGMIGRKSKSAMRVFEFRITDPVRVDLIALSMEASG